jgi:hypothetical protein
MSQQSNYPIARQWATWYGIALSVMPVELRLRGLVANLDLQRWSG